jgi:hypothetical protein
MDMVDMDMDIGGMVIINKYIINLLVNFDLDYLS